MSAAAKIKARVRALLAKAAGTGNGHEAEVFLAKAMELLERHQLSMADLGDAADPIIHHQNFRARRTMALWQRHLYASLAVYYGCWCVVRQGAGIYDYRLVGAESAIVTTELLYPWVAKQVRKAGRDLAKSHGGSVASCTRLVGNALLVRIGELNDRAATAKQDAATPAGRNALAIMDQVEARVRELYPSLGSARPRTVRSSHAAMQAAAGIGLHRQAGAERPLAALAAGGAQ